MFSYDALKNKIFGEKKKSVEAGRVTVSLLNILQGCNLPYDYTAQKHHSFATTRNLKKEFSLCFRRIYYFSNGLNNSC